MAVCTWSAHVLSATSTGAGSARQSGPVTVWAAIGLARHAQNVQKKTWILMCPDCLNIVPEINIFMVPLVVT